MRSILLPSPDVRYQEFPARRRSKRLERESRPSLEEVARRVRRSSKNVLPLSSLESAQ